MPVAYGIIKNQKCDETHFSFFCLSHVDFPRVSEAKQSLYNILTMVGSILCFICYIYALKTLPISLVSIYVYINPIVALLLGVVILHEKISLQIVIGILVTFLGIYLVKKFSRQ